MKTLALLLIVTSCATYIAKTPSDICASQGMKLAGVSSSSGAINGYGRNNQYATSSNGVQCVVPETAYDKCEAEKLLYVLAPVDEYNSNFDTKYKINELAYFAFILPGIGMKLYYDNQQDKAVTEARRRYQEKIGTCDGFRTPAKE